MTEEKPKEVNETDLEDAAGGRGTVSPITGNAPEPIGDSGTRDISAAGTAQPVGGSPSPIGDRNLSNIAGGMSGASANDDSSPTPIGDRNLRDVSGGMSAKPVDDGSDDIKVKVNDI